MRVPFRLGGSVLRVLQLVAMRTSLSRQRSPNYFRPDRDKQGAVLARYGALCRRAKSVRIPNCRAWSTPCQSTNRRLRLFCRSWNTLHLR